MIKSSPTAQRAIINYFKTKLAKEGGVKLIESSRGGPHLRFNYANDATKLLKKLHNVEVRNSDQSISGTFTTQEIILKEKIGNAAVNDGCYLVVTTSSKGVLSTKNLTPDELKLPGIHTKNVFKKNIIAGLKASSAPINIREFCKDLLDASERNDGKITSEFMESISNADITTIAKNFGEISGALWYMTHYNKKATGVEYPNESNFPLVDYFIHEGKKKIAVSAKANDGAPPSINAIADVLRKKTYTDGKMEDARKAIIAISDSSTVDGIINASKELGTEGYKWISKNFKKGQVFTAADCETFMAPYKNAKAVYAELEEFYKLIGRSASVDIIDRTIKGNGKRWGFIISPMGYALVDQLNKTEKYVDVLNDAAKQIKLEQLYIKIKLSQKAVSYEVKLFGTSKFAFEYNANAGQPSLKKISFKMLK